MSRTPSHVFLERRSYRQRRLTDAARLLPVIGVLLFLVPILWVSGSDTPPGTEPAGTAPGVIYIFAVWAGLIVLAGWMSRYLARIGSDAPAQERGE